MDQFWESWIVFNDIDIDKGTFQMFVRQELK